MNGEKGQIPPHIVHPDMKKWRLYEAIGDRVRAFAEERGMSVARLAKEAGLSVYTVENCVRGKSLTVHGLYQIAEAIDCTLDELVPILTNGGT